LVLVNPPASAIATLRGRPGSKNPFVETKRAILYCWLVRTNNQTESSLPTTDGLDIGVLSRIFDDATNSYKHLLFDALLQAFKDGAFRATKLSLNQLAVGMLAEAWHPVRVYRLSLGAQDKIAATIQAIDFENDNPIPHVQLRNRIAGLDIDWRLLMRYVPYRLISPFFARELSGMRDDKRNAAIVELADRHFDTTVPLYRLADMDAVTKATIEIHPRWADYIAANFPIVKGWAERKWITYLQARNPTVPAISEKTGAPLMRNSLAAQTRYWKAVFAASFEPPRCIYSGVLLDQNRFHLDHFLPWTFICHDAIWNLVPVSPEVNAAKGNRLPDVSYLPSLAVAQHRGLLAVRRVMKDTAWTAATSPFVGDLRISEDQLLDPDVMLEAYSRSVGPQLDIARGIGFQSGWRFVA
jgi:hypothetical protein